MNRGAYEEQMSAVTAYIFDHLQDDLDLDRLADIAGFSAFHWHRIYRALRGETAAATVKRLRLQRAAALLAESDLPVRTVARRSGFDNLASFTRAFREVFGMPPAAYRTQGTHALFRPPAPAAALPSHPVEIRDRPEIVLATVLHRGSYLTIGRAFTAAWDALARAGALPDPPRMIALYEDDPEAMPERLLRSRAGLAVAPGTMVPGTEIVTIPAGRHAVLRYRGLYASMQAAYAWFYGTWLPTSGERPRDHPVIEAYLNNPVDTPPHELLTEIILPLE